MSCAGPSATWGGLKGKQPRGGRASNTSPGRGASSGPPPAPLGPLSWFFICHLHGQAWGGPGWTLPPQGGAVATQYSLLAALEASRAGRGQAMEEEVGAAGGLHPPGTWRPSAGDPPDPPHPGAAVAEPPGPGLGLEPLRLAEPPGLGASGEAEPGSGFPEPRSPSGSGRGVLEEPRGGWVERWLQGARRSPRGWLCARCRQRCPVKGRAFIRKFGFFLLLRKAKPRGGREVPPLGGAPKDARGWDATKLLYGMS